MHSHFYADFSQVLAGGQSPPDWTWREQRICRKSPLSGRMVAGGDDGEYASIPGVSYMVRTRLVERVRGEASATYSAKLNAVNGSGD